MSEVPRVHERGSSRLPSLDGVRAVAIGLVLLAHLTVTDTVALLRPLWRWNFGNLGVRVFFVLSGFLITTLLLREFARTGRIDLRSFYVRRALRIFPAFYVMLLALGVAGAAGLVDASWWDVARAGLYVGNYVHLPFDVGHSWSLAVEEQFYLLWPAGILLLGGRRAAWAALAVLAVSPLLRGAYAAWSLVPYQPNLAFETVADALATGALLAMYRDRLWDRATYRGFLSSRWIAVVPVLVLALAMWRSPATIRYVAGPMALNLCVALCLDWAMRFPDGRIGRLLNARPVAWVGVM